MQKNPYQPRSKEEHAKQEECVKEHRKELAVTIELAKKCLAHEDFVKYKEKYLKAREAVVNQIINLNMSDPVLYSFAVREMVTDLRAIRTLLGEVEKDAGRKL